MKKDVDYIIDYDIGQVTFLNQDRIDLDSTIEITYEYTPFGAQTQQTLAGMRFQYNLSGQSHLGTTVIYYGASKPSKIPNIRSTPNSISVLDVDTKLNFKPKWLPFTTTLAGEAAMSSNNPNTMNRALIDNMEGIKEKDITPTNKDIWRIALNPDSSLLNYSWVSWDNEDIKTTDINPNSKSTEETTEVLTLNYSLDPGKSYSIVYPVSNVGQDYSTKEFLEMWLYKESEQNLGLTVSFGSINENSDLALGFREPVYYNNKLIWPVGSPKTEDLNGDGILGPGEDIGWDFYNEDGSITKIGAGNGELDSQDLDGDGVLDAATNAGWIYGTTNNPWIDNENNSFTSLSWSGSWKRIKTPLNIETSGADNITTTDDDNWTNIKHVRITLTNSNSSAVSGKLKLSDLSTVGNKWEKGVITPTGTGNLVVSAINNEDDPAYDPLSETKENDPSSTAKDEYTKLYKGIFFLDDKEQALSLEYSNLQPSSIGYTKYTFNKAMDFSKYKKLGFFVNNDGNNAEFFIEIGANDSNYFVYKETLSSQNIWEYKELILEDIIKDGFPDSFEVVGTPNLSNITQVKIGIKNTTTNILTGKVLVNELFLYDVIKNVGYAYKSSLGFSRDGWFSLIGNYKETDRHFETIRAGSETQLVSTSNTSSGKDIKSGSANASITKIRFLPLNGSVNKTETYTPDTFSTSGSVNEGGLVTQTGKSASTTMKWSELPLLGHYLKYIPNISGSYSNSITDTQLLDKKNYSDSYSGNFSYSMPGKYFFLPKFANDIITFLLPVSLGGKYSKSESELEYLKTKYGQENIKTVTENFSASNIKFNYSLGRLPIIKYIPLIKEPTIGLSPTYSLTRVVSQKMPFTQDTFGDINPQSMSQTAGLSGNVGFKWFNPTFGYNITISETYNLNTNSQTGVVTLADKNISRNSNANTGMSLGMKNILPWFKPFSSLTVSGNYSVQDGDAWQKVDKDYNSLDKIIIRNIEEYKEYQIDESKIKNNGQAFRRSLSSTDNMSSTLRWNPLGFVTFFKNYPFKPLKSIHTTFTYSKTDSDSDTTGTKTFSLSEIWPNASVDIRNPEKLLLLSKWILPLTYFSNTSLTSSYSYKISKSGSILNNIKTPNSKTTNESKSGSYTFKLFEEKPLFFIKKLDFSVNGGESRARTDYVKETSTTTATLDPDFILKNRSYSNAWGAQMSINLKAWKITPRYDTGLSQSFDDKDLITKHTITQTATLNANADFSLPTKIKIPFINKYLSFSNRLRLNNVLRANFITDQMDINQNKDEYSYSFSGTYDMRQNFTMTLGAKYLQTMFKSEEKKKDNFYSISANATISIVF